MERDQRHEEIGYGGGSVPSVYSDHDTTLETSFITATEDEEVEPSTRRSILGLVDNIDTHTQSEIPDDTESVRSSRSMPVPAYLDRRAEKLQGARNDPNPDLTVPPPSYDDAIKAPDYPAELEGEEIEEDLLSAAEVAVVMRMQESRGDYLPERRGSYAEAIEMRYRDCLKIDHSADGNSGLDVHMNNSGRVDTSDTDGPDADHVPRPPSLHSVEEGRQSGGEADHECTCFGPLNGPMTWMNRYIHVMSRYIRAMSTTKLILFSAVFVAILGVILFLALFPNSFVYVEYHELALAQSKMTNKVDRDTIYYPGCYVLGPDTRLIRFTGSVHNIIEQIDVFTLDTISITMRYNLQYFLRPTEVGKLYTMFTMDYDQVFRKIIISSIKNLAGTTLTVDWFRFNRTYVERTMHSMLRKRLGGNCCPECCPSGCQSNAYCSECVLTNCDQGYHVDVRYFNLLSVGIPSEIFERFLHLTILEIEKEREFFLQDNTVIKKETEVLTRQIENEANQIVQKGQFESNKIAVVAAAEKEKKVQTSYVAALKGMYSRMNITQEDHKVSLMLVRALEDNAENLYGGYGFDKNTLYKP